MALAGSSSATHVLQSCNAKKDVGDTGDASATFLPLAAIPGIRVIVNEGFGDGS